MSDSLTGKTFQEIGNTIAVSRLQNFLEKRSMYCARFQLLHDESSSTINNASQEDFGSMDDPGKFNQKLQPTVEFLIEFHNDYLDNRSEFIKNYNDNLKIHPVQSIDATFNVGKRTHESVIDEGEGEADDIMRRRSIKKKGLLLAMNGDCGVSWWKRVGESETKADIKEYLEYLKKNAMTKIFHILSILVLIMRLRGPQL